jgi:molybdate transport system ATP-binding protein
MSLRAQLRLALRDFTLDVDLCLPATGVTALIGPSGSGKTSVLRCIAGLERAARGTLQFRDEVWQDAQRFVPAHARAIGYVFQDARLFPHLSVRQNLEFGLKRVPQSARRIPFDQAVSLLSLQALLARRPDSLSGGERQRVAIGRALLTSPALLLMDEPLASLDLESRAQILPYFEGLERSLQLPMLYVTHAPAEVVRLASRVIWLEAGQVRAQGPLNDVLTRPDLPLAHFADAGAVLDATVVEHAPDYRLTYVAVGRARLAISERDLAPGSRTRVHVRARDVSLWLTRPERSSISNLLEVQLIDIHLDRDPAHRLVRLRCEGAILLARITYRSVVELALHPGLALFAQVKSVALVD